MCQEPFKMTVSSKRRIKENEFLEARDGTDQGKCELKSYHTVDRAHKEQETHDLHQEVP